MRVFKNLKHLGKVLIYAPTFMLIVGVIVGGALLGWNYFPTATAWALSFAAIMSLIVMGLCKAAAKGNVYCPQCGSEDNVPADIHEVDNPDNGRIFRVCKACQNIW